MMNSKPEFRELQAAAGVFERLVNFASFFDRVSLSVQGTRRRWPLDSVECRPSIPIGGPNRPYARAIHGVCLRSGNPFELRYGANPHYRHLPAASLRFRSEGCPLTLDEITLVARSLFCGGFHSQVGLLEFTFDVTGTTVFSLANRCVYSLRCELRLIDDNGRHTVYIGSPRSPLQIRIYDKLSGLVRMEFVMRRRFLRLHGINQVGDVDRVRALDMPRFIRFCEWQKRSQLAKALEYLPSGWRKQRLSNWPDRWPLQIWAGAMRHWKVDPTTYLKSSPLQHAIENMQRKLIW